jgi:hypothetical protein
MPHVSERILFIWKHVPEMCPSLLDLLRTYLMPQLSGWLLLRWNIFLHPVYLPLMLVGLCVPLLPSRSIPEWRVMLRMQCSPFPLLSGYYLDSLQCFFCSTAIPHCQLCSSSTVCTSCSPSFAINPLNSSQCVTCLSLIPNCQICSDSSSCSLCISGSYPSGSSCLSCSLGCVSCNSASVCNKCLD